MGMLASSVRVAQKTCIFLMIAESETYEKFQPLEGRQKLFVWAVGLEYFSLQITEIFFVSLLLFLFPILSQ